MSATYQSPSFFMEIANKLYPLVSSGLLLYPLQRLQNIMQTQDTFKQLKPHTTIQMTRQIRYNQGLFAFYRGATSYVYKSIYTVVLIQTISEPVHKLFNYETSVDVSQWILYGSSFLANILTYPFQISKLRLQLDMAEKYAEPLYPNTKQCLKNTYKFEGLRALFKGLTLSCLQNFVTLYMMNKCYKLLSENLEQPKYSLAICASLFAQLVVYPIDTIKKKMQINGAINHNSLYKSAWKCLSKTVQNQGIAGLYRGFPIRMTYSPLYGYIYLQISSGIESNKITV